MKALLPVMAPLNEALEVKLANMTTSAYLSGDVDMVTWGRTAGGLPIPYEGPPMDRAVSFAKARSAELVKGLDDETRRRMATVISGAIQDKTGLPKLAQAIHKHFEDMRNYRSLMIARTETANALEQAFMDRAEDMGVDMKEWVTFDPCEICEQNEREGVVPLHHVFSSGHERPPAHPNCRCALVPVIGPKASKQLEATGPKITQIPSNDYTYNSYNDVYELTQTAAKDQLVALAELESYGHKTTIYMRGGPVSRVTLENAEAVMAQQPKNVIKNVSSVVLDSNRGYEFTVGTKRYTCGGFFNSHQGQICIYDAKTRMYQDTIRQILPHEFGHAGYQELRVIQGVTLSNTPAYKTFVQGSAKEGAITDYAKSYYTA